MNEKTTVKNPAQCDASLLKPNWTTDAKSLLLDLKCLMKEYYLATFTSGDKNLKIAFENGQAFTLSIKEIKR